MARWQLVIWTVLALAVLRPVWAQELNFLGGYVTESGNDDSAVAWEIEYRQEIGDGLAASLAWINEGHLDHDRRDGPAAQLWRRSRLLDDRLTLSAGAGAYYWFDTEQDLGRAVERIHHGLGGVVSLDATWRASSHWQWSVRGNWIGTNQELDTLSVSLGVGYLLGPNEPTEQQAARARQDELTVLGGEAIFNSLGSDSSFAYEVEYRRVAGRYSDWTLGLISENERRVNRRLGVVSQAWAVRPFSDGLWTIGAGAGAYVSLTDEDDESAIDAETLSGLLTVTASRRLSDRWSARFLWNRLVTSNEADADMLLLGLGYGLH